MIDFINSLGFADPVGVFTLILLVCVAALCVAAVLAVLGGRGLLYAVALLVIVLITSPLWRGLLNMRKL